MKKKRLDNEKENRKPDWIERIEGDTHETRHDE